MRDSILIEKWPNWLRYVPWAHGSVGSSPVFSTWWLLEFHSTYSVEIQNRGIGESGHPACFGSKRTRRFESYYLDQYGEVAQLVSSRWTENPEMSVRSRPLPQRIEITVVSVWDLRLGLKTGSFDRELGKLRSSKVTDWVEPIKTRTIFILKMGWLL